ncbi:16865_t:CDS:1, partial [Dentiscutata heterogama]
IQAKLNKLFRIPFKNIQNQTQHIEIAEDQTLFKNVQDQIQHIEITKNQIPFKVIQDQTQNIEITKNITTNIFKFHNSGNAKIIFK